MNTAVVPIPASVDRIAFLASSTAARRLCRRVAAIETVRARPRVERTAGYERTLGYDELVLRFHATASP